MRQGRGWLQGARGRCSEEHGRVEIDPKDQVPEPCGYVGFAIRERSKDGESKVREEIDHHRTGRHRATDSEPKGHAGDWRSQPRHLHEIARAGPRRGPIQRASGTGRETRAPGRRCRGRRDSARVVVRSGSARRRSRLLLIGKYWGNPNRGDHDRDSHCSRCLRAHRTPPGLPTSGYRGPCDPRKKSCVVRETTDTRLAFQRGGGPARGPPPGGGPPGGGPPGGGPPRGGPLRGGPGRRQPDSDTVGGPSPMGQ